MSKHPKWCLVDTNVAIVANGRSRQASRDLTRKCIDALQEITRGTGLVLDANGEIFEEYRRNLSLSGQPGVGDMFLKWVHDNQWTSARCERRRITPIPDDPRAYEEFPLSPALAKFDASDRKFVAVACAGVERRPILEAVDFKWWGWREVLQAEGVRVVFVDEAEAQKGYAKHIGHV
jgi:hypothetical protein